MTNQFIGTQNSMSISDAFKLKPKQWVNGVFMCLGTVAPGSLIIYQFRPDLFIALDSVKLLIIATAITLPLVVLNVLTVVPRVLMNGKIEIDSEELVDQGELYLTACTATGIALYPSIVAAHIWALHFKQFCLLVIVLEVVIAARNWLTFLLSVRR